jgi:hypothetical protein
MPSQQETAGIAPAARVSAWDMKISVVINQQARRNKVCCLENTQAPSRTLVAVNNAYWTMYTPPEKDGAIYRDSRRISRIVLRRKTIDHPFANRSGVVLLVLCS